MTVHTITLEMQGVDSQTAERRRSFRRVVDHSQPHRCEHEADGPSGAIRRCRNRATEIVGEMHVCARHAEGMR